MYRARVRRISGKWQTVTHHSWEVRIARDGVCAAKGYFRTHQEALGGALMTLRKIERKSSDGKV